MNDRFIATDDTSQPGHTLQDLALYLLKLGTIGFDGPVALVGDMHLGLMRPRARSDAPAGAPLQGAIENRC
jgi:hypothetical protein